MNKDNKYDILKAISYIKNKKQENFRKIKSSDLVFKSNNNLNNNNPINKEKIKSFRMQEEFGPKKRIKP
jgi:hypothetical protein